MADAEKKGPRPPRTDRDIASASGIPLQSFLAELVRKHFSEWPDQWHVEAEEVPAGDEGFVDMLLVSRQGVDPSIRMAVEVKRFYLPKEKRPMRLLFMAPREPKRPTSAPAVLPCRLPGEPDPGEPDDQPLRHLLYAAEFYMDKHDPGRIAEHCEFEERRSQDMDDIAGKLLRQMEALSLANAGNEGYAFIPTIVTNAELRVLRIGDVSLESGELTSGAPDGTVVPWVCYEKTLSQTGLVPFASPPAKDFAEWAQNRLRTVFVVQAKHFIEFLTRFNMKRRSSSSG